MRIGVLCEDSSLNPKYGSEHGLSLLITTKSHKILFDFGQSDLFSKNAEKMGENLHDVDIAVISHGHYDHCNGLRHFLAINKSAKIYIHPSALGDFFHGEKYIGMDPCLKELRDRFVFISENTALDEELELICGSGLPEYHNDSLFESMKGACVFDRFDHELYLTVREKEQCVLFTGCGHRGIGAISQLAYQRKVSSIVGGFHLTDDLPSKKQETVAEKLGSLPLRYFSGHCTGCKAEKILSKVLGNRFQKIASGMQIGLGGKGEVAGALFRSGYNCSQAVLGAFAEELGLPFEFAMKIACSFGGGMGRLREVCGAVSGMLLVCGIRTGYSTPETGELKADHYRLVQSLVNEFRDKHGSIYCRELLGGTAGNQPIPSERTASFYNSRPCERLIVSAAEILEKRFL